MHRLAHVARLAIIPFLVAALAGATLVSAAETAPVEPSADATTAVISGTGTLAAHGSGYARLAGSYVLTGSMDGGWIRISGLTAEDTVRVTGWSAKVRLADGTLIFRNVHGSYYVAGRRIVTEISSPAMRFVATGHGRAHLRGEGEYWVNGHGPFPWSSDGAESDF